MKSGRQCRDCLITIHKKCEEKFNTETICTHEPVHLRTNQISSPSDDDLKNLVNIEINDVIPVPPTITTDSIETTPIKNNYEMVSMPTNNRTIATPTIIATPPTTATTANRLSTKAAAAFSALDSTARRSFRAFGNKNVNPTTTITTAPTTTSLTPSLSSTTELSKSDESLSNSSTISTKKPTITNPNVHTSSKLANAASSAYSKFREFKTKRLPVTTETNPIKKTRSTSDSSEIFKDLR